MIDLTYIWPGTGQLAPHACAAWWSHCRLRIYKHAGRTVVVLSAPEEPSGTSITNAAEYLATRITNSFRLDPTVTVWVEHYGPWRSGGVTFDLVTFAWEERCASSPRWQRASREVVEALIGQPLNP